MAILCLNTNKEHKKKIQYCRSIVTTFFRQTFSTSVWVDKPFIKFAEKIQNFFLSAPTFVNMDSITVLVMMRMWHRTLRLHQQALSC